MPNMDLYRPLDIGRRQIRLVSLFPAADAESDPVTCDLNVCSLSDNPSYETVSYVWGDASRQSELVVNNQPLRVPANAIAALKRLRLQHDVRVIWMDSICINQRDHAERASQVSLMGDIYRGGNRNLIYLDDDNDKTVEGALQSINALMSTEIEPLFGKGQFLLEATTEHGVQAYNDAKLPVEVNQPALIRFFTKPWFRRIWIVQEAVLAKENLCHCGTWVFDLLNVLRVAFWLTYRYKVIEPDLGEAPGRVGAYRMYKHLNNLKDPQRSRKVDPYGGSLADMLQLSKDFEATDARDKVNAVLSLCAWSFNGGQVPEILKADYTKSIAEVFAIATRYAMYEILVSDPSIASDEPSDESFPASLMRSHTSPLHILQYVSHKYTEELTFSPIPSWVPRWHRPNEIAGSRTPLFYNFWASKNSRADMSGDQLLVREDWQHLKVQGFIFDCIRTTLPWDDEGLSGFPGGRTDFLSGLPEIRKFMVQSGEIGDHEAFESALCQTIMLGRSWDLDYLLPEHVEVCKATLLLAESGFDTTPTVLTYAELPDLLQCRYHLQTSCKRRKFCYSLQGQIGSVPDLARPTDLLVILFGAKLPYILRKCERGFKLVGPAYIQRMMYGAAVDEWRARGGQAKTFALV